MRCSSAKISFIILFSHGFCNDDVSPVLPPRSDLTLAQETILNFVFFFLPGGTDGRKCALPPLNSPHLGFIFRMSQAGWQAGENVSGFSLLLFSRRSNTHTPASSTAAEHGEKLGLVYYHKRGSNTADTEQNVCCELHLVSGGGCRR